MSHLSRDERLVALDDTLEPARRCHLADCRACRTEVEALRSVLASVRAVEVPEPSPLFWDHLATRVGDAIAREPAPTMAAVWWSPRLAWAVLVVIVTTTGAGYLMRPALPQPTSVSRAVPTRSEPARVDAHAVPMEIDGGSIDDGWALLAAVAEDAGADETFAPVAGQAELSISSLSPEERTALAGELAAELAPDRTREG